MDRYANLAENQRKAVLGPGVTDPSLRRAVFARAVELAGGVAAPADFEIPAELRKFVDDVALHAWRTTDEEVEALRRAGYSEEAIYEISVTVSAGAGLERLERGLAALRGGSAMRLKGVQRGKGIMRLLLPVISWKVGGRVPDIVRTLVHRPKFFGGPFNAWIHRDLRGPPPGGAVWERELMASFTSSLNQLRVLTGRPTARSRRWPRGRTRWWRRCSRTTARRPSPRSCGRCSVSWRS